MPYTPRDLNKACDMLLGADEALRLTPAAKVLTAAYVGFNVQGRSLLSPSMRVVHQALDDLERHGDFRFAVARE